MSDFPQILLQNAARMFVADLTNAGHHKAAEFLQNKYINNAQYEGRRINYVPANNPSIAHELIEG